MIQFVLFTKQLGIPDLESLLYDTVCAIYKTIEYSEFEKNSL